jgi:hypothetical protein
LAAKGYWREISAVLVAKTIAIIALYFLFIAPSGDSPVTAAKVADHLVPTGAPSGAPTAATDIQP